MKLTEKIKLPKLLLILLFAMITCAFAPLPVAAAELLDYDDYYYDDYDDYYDDYNDYDDYYDDYYYDVPEEEENLTLYFGDKGTFAFPTMYMDQTGAMVPVSSRRFSTQSYWDSILTVDAYGNYQVTDVGSTDVVGEFYDMSGKHLLTKTYHVTAKVDMSSVTLDKTSATAYVEQGGYSAASFEFRLIPGTKPLPSTSYNYDIEAQSLNSDMDVYAYMEENQTVSLSVYGSGTADVTLTIYDNSFQLKLKVIEVGINKNSLLLATKQTGQLKMIGLKKGVTWSSSNPSVAKVTSGGKVKALKSGNTIIKATVGNFTAGCAVSVVSPKKYKAIKTAIKIAKTSTYSQPKRMEKGYYDCSSLTWRAYKSAGITLVNANYAPTAAEQGKWCVQKKKTVKGGLSEKNVQNMKLHAGDLMFEEGDKNDRYRGIYHVEMITGYVCYGFYEDGKPIVGIKWAARPDNNYWCMGQLVGRP